MELPVKIKRSGTASSTPSSLDHGELAINYADATLFWKDATNTIRSFVFQAYASATHNHDDRYYTESEVDSLLAGKAASSHTHTFSQISDITFPSPLENNSIVVYTDGVGWGVANYIGTIGVGSQPLGGWPAGSVGASLAGKANSSHVHSAGDITSGTLTAERLPLATTTSVGGTIVGTGLGVSSGTVSVSYGTTAGTACQGNDSRLSDARSPTPHSHGNITNAGAIGSTSGVPIITGTSGVLQAGAFGTTAGTFCAGNDSRLADSRTPSGAAGGDLSGTYPNPSLANTTVVAASYGSASSVATFTVDAKGRLTTASSTAIAISGTAITSGTVAYARLPVGSAASTICAGNDARLSDARTPTDGSVTTAKIANDAVTYAKIQNVTATDRILGRSTSGAGDIEEIVCTSFARTLLDDTTNTAARTTLGAAASSHTHGNITNAGAIGATANLPVITTTSGVLTVGSFGAAANTFCQGNDVRLARAWVNFNGTGTVAIRSSYNVSSITDNGVGLYTVNFTTAMPDTNYAYHLSAEGRGASNRFVFGFMDFSVNVGSLYFQVNGNLNGTNWQLAPADTGSVNVVIFR